jgi:glyoxylase-like metal-dependent hydrolase (beta-lactamase superfamily II)
MPRRFTVAAALVVLACCAIVAESHAASAQAPSVASDTTWQVYAIRYATIPDFPVWALVAGADSARRLDIAMVVWLLRQPGRCVLVDAGFERDALIQRWKPADYVRPSDALARFGVPADSVSDVIVTHVHWDHLDGADLFPKARVWIQRDEYAHHVGPEGRPADAAIDSVDAAMLAALEKAGRLMLVEGDGRELLPGVTVYTGGRHTFASQYVGVRIDSGTVVIASDNAYLYENLEREIAIAQTLDPAANLAAQRRMKRIASSARLVVPGHDAAVFARFPGVAPGVVRIR